MPQDVITVRAIFSSEPRLTVLHFLAGAGSASAVEIGEGTGLATRTLYLAIQELEVMGVLRASAPRDPMTRKKARYWVDADVLDRVLSAGVSYIRSRPAIPDTVPETLARTIPDR